MKRLRGRRLAMGTALFLLALVATAGVAMAVVVAEGNLRITVLSQIQPYRLPRAEAAPIAVFLAGHVATRSGAVPPQLQRMTIKVNRHGLLQSRGLPTCPLARIQPGSTARALDRCADALIGSGRFWASIVLPDQRPYPTRGRLLLFNGRQAGRAAIFAHIYTTLPFATSFVIVFRIKHIDEGPFGTELSASLPRPSAAGASSTGSSSRCGANTATGAASAATSTPAARPRRKPASPPFRWPSRASTSTTSSRSA